MLSMRWDPLEDRRYALMDRDPTTSDNKARTVWMGNLLAYRALVLSPAVPTQRRLATTAWQLINGESSFTWPTWEAPIRLDTIRTLLQCPELWSSEPSKVLRARGIVAVFRARRLCDQATFKINFSPARSV